MSPDPKGSVNNITDKDWLELAWKHFQQHAQQRLSYFNYFVIFSTILSTGLVSTFQNNFSAPFLGIGIGMIQSFLAFMFWKIDERNRLLTKHGENVIKEIENDYERKGHNSYSLFNGEVLETNKQLEIDKNKCFLFRHMTHGSSYRIIFIVFFFIGLTGSSISVFKSINYTENFKETKETTINLRIDKVDSLDNLFLKTTSEINAIKRKINIIESQRDTIKNPKQIKNIK